MNAVPKPPKAKSSPQRPKMTEFDYEEIGEKIGEAMEFESEVEITIYFEKELETFSGVIRDADGQTGKLTLYTNSFTSIKINIMSIVNVK